MECHKIFGLYKLTLNYQRAIIADKITNATIGRNRLTWINVVAVTCSVAVENVARKLPRVAGSGQFGWQTGKRKKCIQIIVKDNIGIISKECNKGKSKGYWARL